MVGLFQVYPLVARVEVSVCSTPCHARREDLLPCKTTKWEIYQLYFYQLYARIPNWHLTLNGEKQKVLKTNSETMLFLEWNEKKRHPNSRIIEVDQGSLTPLRFTVARGMGSGGRDFYKRLTTLLSLKKGNNKSIGTSWKQSKVNFASLWTMFLCWGGSRQILVIEKVDIELKLTSITKIIEQSSCINCTFNCF